MSSDKPFITWKQLLKINEIMKDKGSVSHEEILQVISALQASTHLLKTLSCIMLRQYPQTTDPEDIPRVVKEILGASVGFMADYLDMSDEETIERWSGNDEHTKVIANAVLSSQPALIKRMRA